MDYKYITQLLERYWECKTSLEEEEILRAFFSQKDIPAELAQYKDLFAYEHLEPKADVLGEDFDNRILSMIEEPVEHKARIISLTQRLRPLFKAAAVVAIFITLGNAAQVPFNDDSDYSESQIGVEDARKGASVAMGDSAIIDTLQQSSIKSAEPSDINILK
jgi:hypothetical protein